MLRLSHDREKICIIRNFVSSKTNSPYAEAWEIHSGRSVYGWLDLFTTVQPQLASHGAYSTTGDHDAGDVWAVHSLLLLPVQTAWLAILEPAIYGQCLVLESSVAACASVSSVVAWESLEHPNLCALYTMHSSREILRILIILKFVSIVFMPWRFYSSVLQWVKYNASAWHHAVMPVIVNHHTPSKVYLLGILCPQCFQDFVQPTFMCILLLWCSVMTCTNLCSHIRHHMVNAAVLSSFIVVKPRTLLWHRGTLDVNQNLVCEKVWLPCLSWIVNQSWASSLASLLTKYSSLPLCKAWPTI